MRGRCAEPTSANVMTCEQVHSMTASSAAAICLMQGEIPRLPPGVFSLLLSERVPDPPFIPKGIEDSTHAVSIRLIRWLAFA